MLLNSGISETKNTNKQLNINVEQKIKELSDEINKKDNLIKNLQMQIEMSINTIEKICNNFSVIISKKDREIKKKTKECDNLIAYINNKIKSNIPTCPLCCESALNNEQYSNINIFLNEIENKLSNKDKLLKEIQEKYKDLIIQTTQMKKIFFNHMNLKIAKFF